MANFVTTSSPADYIFFEIYIKSTLALITYPGAVFTVEDILNVLALSQTTNVNEITRRNFLGFQALAVLNYTLSNNLLIYG